MLAFSAQQDTAWVDKSNEDARVLLEVWAKYKPEEAAATGFPGFDEQITVLSWDAPAHIRRDIRAARTELERRLAAERDPRVKQDLEILIAAAGRALRSSEAEERLLLPYTSVSDAVFYGLQSLLADQVAPERRTAALVRLRKYTGLEPGYQPMTKLSEQLFLAKIETPGLLGPARVEVENNLGNTRTYVEGIGQLFEKYRIPGYQEAYSKLKEQLADYEGFVRKHVLPRARAFRLPPELYALALDNYGVDYTPDELIRTGHRDFIEIRHEMQKVAARVARARGWLQTDYLNVIRQLKEEQLHPDAILQHYNHRLQQIEEIIRRERLVTLPARPAMIRLATAAETAQQPAPHMVAPPLMNNRGERGEFVLPLETAGEGGKTLKYDDFTFAAASWTLTAHEARPGHEMQFSAMIEHGVSIARAVIAYNSTNIEGWGLYAEWMMLPYMPDDGKLISLQFRLHRAARAFLDPELQRGEIAPEQAKRFLQNEVGLSEAYANEEVERFTFRMPGQAVTYFDGLKRLLEIRAAAEEAMGPHFNAQRFHDFILSQGLLPPSLLRSAVMTDFVQAARNPQP
jgi:hypothetical protein